LGQINSQGKLVTPNPAKPAKGQCSFTSLKLMNTSVNPIHIALPGIAELYGFNGCKLTFGNGVN